MMKFLKNINKLSVLGFILCVTVVLVSGDALAEATAQAATATGGGSPYSKCQGGTIFETLRCMIANTLRDIRNIVYVVGGIGLITFTFAAIFGKISFKHLANICISLFLLSMMSPFVAFFSGSETALVELEYGLYLSPDDGNVADDSNVTGVCKGSNCPSSSSGVVGGGSGSSGQTFVPGETGANNSSSRAAGGGTNTSTTVDGGTIDEVVVTAQAPELPSITGLATVQNPKATDLVMPTLTSNNTEVDTRTGWQKFKDGINRTVTEGRKAYNTASTLYSAAKNIHTAGKSTVNAIKNADSLGDVLMAGTVAMNSVQNIASNVTMAAGAVGGYTDQKMLNDINDQIDRLIEDSQNNPNNAAENGKKIAELQQQAREGTAQAKTEDFLDGVYDVTNEGSDVLGAGISIGNTARAGVGLINDIINLDGFH